jgi:hypothetical protein
MTGCGSAGPEAAIYENYVNAHQSKDRSGKPIPQIVVLDRSVGWDCRDLIEKAALELAVPKAVIENWKERNAPAVAAPNVGLPINPLLHFSIPHILISNGTRSEIMAAGGWTEFNRRFPNSR